MLNALGSLPEKCRTCGARLPSRADALRELADMVGRVERGEPTTLADVEHAMQDVAPVLYGYCGAACVCNAQPGPRVGFA